MRVPPAEDPLVEAEAQLVLVVDGSPADERTLAGHLQYTRIDPLSPGERSAFDRFGEAAPYRVRSVRCEDDQPDRERRDDGVAHYQPQGARAAEHEGEQPRTQRHDPAARARVHDGEAEQGEDRRDQPARAQQRSLGTVLEPEQHHEPRGEDHGTVVGVLPEGGDALAPPPDRMGGPRDPHHRQEGADGAGERQDNHGESSDARGLKQIIRGPEHQHGLQQQGEQLGDLSSIISVVHVRGGGVACVPHSGNGKRVQVQ